jgi:hypothetical protein
MARVSRGVQAHAKHKKILKKAKGYYGARSKVYRVAKQECHRTLKKPVGIRGSPCKEKGRIYTVLCGLPKPQQGHNQRCLPLCISPDTGLAISLTGLILAITVPSCKVWAVKKHS